MEPTHSNHLWAHSLPMRILPSTPGKTHNLLSQGLCIQKCRLIWTRLSWLIKTTRISSDSLKTRFKLSARHCESKPRGPMLQARSMMLALSLLLARKRLIERLCRLRQPIRKVLQKIRKIKDIKKQKIKAIRSLNLHRQTEKMSLWIRLL